MLFRMILLIALTTGLQSAVSAGPLSYELNAEQVAPGTWVVQGKLEDFSSLNGGNIVNTGFIVTDDGVVVIDTGPSRRYGEALRKLISTLTDQPVRLVFNTHHHPDHFLGNQAFSDVGIQALPITREQIALHGNAFAENMYRLVGDWMRSTEVVLPSENASEPLIELGDHRIRLLRFTGHSGADLVLFDESTGVLFASDMVFYQRALTTPHTPGIPVWLGELERIRDITFSVLVPGHGPVVSDGRALDQMQAYLRWLDNTLTESARSGLTMTEVIALPVPQQFQEIALTKSEFSRSVAHLYPAYEARFF
ncbi:MAG: quinoprotein relay system zinc metallohydrolase 1 [Amphritea sp.]|nr:quinoprotein relay system zinc metallohydrolase 1 [Amphritea sp.]